MHSDADHFEEINSRIAKEINREYETDPSRLNRHRGMWSFLTRFFYLGQIFVVHQFLNSTAHAAQTADEDGDRTSPDSDPSGSTNGFAATLAGIVGGDDSGAVAAAAAKEASPVAGKMAAGTSQEIPSGDGAPFQADKLDAGGGQPVAAKAATEGEAGDTPVAPGDGHQDPGHSGSCEGGDSACGPHVGIDTGVIDIELGLGDGISLDLDITNLIDLDIPLDLGALTEPVVALVDDTLGLVTDAVVNTTTLLTNVADTATDVLETTIGAVVPVVDDVVELVGTVGNTALDAVASTLDGVGSAVGTTVAGLTDTVDDLTGSVTDTLGETVGGLGSVVDSTVAGLSSTISGVTGSLSLAGDVGSSGSISFLSTTVSSTLNPDTLFDGGKYTDLNIAMRTDTGAGSEPLSDLVHSTTSSLTDVLLGNAEDADSIDIGTGHGHGLLASIIPDTGKGGLAADLFS